MRYTSYLDIERQARQAVLSAEKRRDDISESIACICRRLASNSARSGPPSLSKSTNDSACVSKLLARRLIKAYAHNQSQRLVRESHRCLAMTDGVPLATHLR